MALHDLGEAARVLDPALSWVREMGATRPWMCGETWKSRMEIRLYMLKVPGPRHPEAMATRLRAPATRRILCENFMALLPTTVPISDFRFSGLVSHYLRFRGGHPFFS
jgi:hypothetical protein